MYKIINNLVDVHAEHILTPSNNRNGLWPKRTMAELECGRNVSKALELVNGVDLT
jgi:hypothetical protein